MPASLHRPPQRCHPWPILPRVHTERSALAMHPTKRRQEEQEFLLPVSFAERNHLRVIALPGAAAVNPSRLRRANPEQVHIGARTGRRPLPEKELVSSVPYRETLRLVNAMDEQIGRAH